MKPALWFALLLCGLCVRAAEGTADQAFQAWFREALEEELREEPLQATQLGEHRYDDQLDDLSRDALNARLERLRRRLSELRRVVDARLLSRDSQIDFDIVERDLLRRIWLAENTDPWSEDPRIYNGYISDSVYLLFVQSTLPLEDNVEHAMARIRQIPHVLDAARANLHHPPKTHTETAIRQIRGAIAFYQETLGALARGSRQRGELITSGNELAGQLQHYRDFLEQELMPRADGNWRLGRERFGQKLDLVLDAGLSADEIQTEAQREFLRVRSEMAFVARQLWHRYFPAEAVPPDDEEGRQAMTERVLAAVGHEHGEARHLTRDARRIVRQLKSFIRERDVLRLPDPDQCAVIEMPEFQRGNSTAFLNPAPPLDAQAGSFYAVSPPPADWSAERMESFLEEYNRHMLHILSIHEGYPGHYVQLEYANRHPSLVRKVIGSGPFVEGWAVYTEQMMLDEGYGAGDLRLRLMQLKFYLRAVVNALLDYRMHCTEMSEEEAMRLLTRDAFQSEGEARLKVIRSRQSSVQLTTYFVGRMALYRLRQEIQRELGDRFDLGRFHEAVLAHGSVPVKYLPELVRRRLEEPR